MRPTPHDPTDDLVRRAHLVRGLVRALVADGTDAEDVEQQVWLAAVRKPPRAGYAWKPWVAGVVRHLHFTLARDRSRRARRERAAAREDAQASTLDASARLEATRRLLGEVAALAEPWKTTIMLRFLDDLPPRAIARRMGVPVATVRTRVRTGLQQLRSRLGGRRDDWLAALLPVSGAWPAHGIGGAFLMSTKAKALAALAAGMLLLGWFAWPGSGSEALPDEHTAPAATSAASVAEPQAAQRDEVPETHASGRPAAPTAWVVRGRVLRESGDTVPRAAVRAEYFLGDAGAGTPASSELVQAGADGAFAWTASAPRGAATLRLRAQAERHAGAVCTVRVFAGDPPPADVCLLLEPLELEASGTVVDANGAPLAGASVRLADSPFDLEATTDASGRYVLALPGGPTDRVLQARAAGHALGTAQAGAGRDAGARAALAATDFTLRREVVVRGSIWDARGAPVPGAVVESCATPELRAESDAGGAYALAHIAPTTGGPVRLRIRAPGFVAQEAEVEISDYTSARDFVLERGGVLTGTVADEHGKPLQGACVALVRRSPGPVVRTYTGADGAFTIEGVAGGEQRLLVQRRGYAPRELRAPTSGTEPLVIRLEPTATLRGSVVDGRNQPVSGVKLGFLSRSAEAARYEAATVTDGAGKFEVLGLPRWGATAELSKPGYHPVKLDVPGEGSGLVLALVRCGVVAGSVIDALTKEPLPRFRIRVFVDEVGPPRELAFEAQDGRWETRAEYLPLHAGTFVDVEAAVEGHVPARLKHVPVSDEPRHEFCALALTRGAIVRGRVVEEDGSVPLEGALVTVLRDGASPERVRTGATGSFEFAGLAIGAVRISVEHPSYAAHIDGPFEVGAPGTFVERIITLSPTGSLEGMVLDPTGAPVPNATLVLRPLVITTVKAITKRRCAPSESWIQFNAYESGKYKITKLKPGPYVLARVDQSQKVHDVVITTDLFRTPLDVGVDLKTFDLDPRCGTGAVKVTRVYDMRRQPPVAALRPVSPIVDSFHDQVLEAPPDDQDESGETMRSWGTPAVLDGTTVIRGLPPGKYLMPRAFLMTVTTKTATGQTTIGGGRLPFTVAEGQTVEVMLRPDVRPR